MSPSGSSGGDFEYYVLSDDALEYLENTNAKAVGRIAEAPVVDPIPVVDPGPVVESEDRVADGPE